MPAYELFLVVKNLQRPDLVKSIKRGAELIISKNGIIRSFENLGFRNLPYKMKANDGQHTHGNYCLIKFDVPSKETTAIDQEIKKDEDYIRSCITKLTEYDESFKQKCQCKEMGQFQKNGFDFRNPMTSYHKKKIYKDYGVRM